MSSSGTLSNYYVDSLIGHEGDEVVAGRFGPPGPGTQGRPAGVADSPAAAAAEFASCSFAPKSAVFSASWSAVPAQPPAAAAMSGLYHPYVPPPPLAASASDRANAVATSCPTGPRADLPTVCQPCRGHIFSLPGSHSQGSEPTPVAAAFFAAPGCWAGSCLQDCGRPGPRRHSPESSDSTGMSVPLRSLSVDSGRKRGDGVGCETLA